jgi:hypothetical protein
MATMPTYEAATGMAPRESGARPQLGDTRAALDRAVQAYEQTVYQSRTVTALAFFLATVIAVGTQGSAAEPLLGLVAIALLSAVSSIPLARYRFRAEITRIARHAGLAEMDARELATAMLSDWSPKAKRATT